MTPNREKIEALLNRWRNAVVSTDEAVETISRWLAEARNEARVELESQWRGQLADMEARVINAKSGLAEVERIAEIRGMRSRKSNREVTDIERRAELRGIEWGVEWGLKHSGVPYEEWPQSWDAGFPGLKMQALLDYAALEAEPSEGNR